MPPSSAEVPDDAAPQFGAASAGKPADELALAVAGLAGDPDSGAPALDRAERVRLLGRLVRGLRERDVRALYAPRKAIQWISDAVTELAPHVPVRTLATLRAHYPGLDGEALAERLVRNAGRATAGVGAVGGGITAVQWAAPPTLLSTPVLLAAETIAVVGIELKLVGELHEVYGQPIAGIGAQRTVAVIQAWAARRGVNPIVPGSGLATVLSTATRKQLRDMLIKRFGRNLTTLGPLLSGAAVASYLNNRATRKVGDELRRDLRLRYGRPAPLPPGSGG